MQTVEINVAGWTVTKNVPSTEAEYNALAPKRANACVEDANFNTIYRGTSPVVRDGICELLEAEGVARVNHGTEDKPDWEKEGVHIKRALAQLVQDRGVSEENLRALLQPRVQKIADQAPFDPSERESKGTGPVIGKRDLALADQIIKDGKESAIAGKLALILGREVATDQKSLARAIADNRRALAAKAEAEQKASLGL